VFLVPWEKTKKNPGKKTSRNKKPKGHRLSITDTAVTDVQRTTWTSKKKPVLARVQKITLGGISPRRRFTKERNEPATLKGRAPGV